jgi:hypothetical protein
MASRVQRKLTNTSWLCGALAVLACACGSRVDTQDSQTHWLACEEDDECGTGRVCVDRVCVTDPVVTPDAASESDAATSSPPASAPIPTDSPASDAALPSCASRSVLECVEAGCALILGTESDGTQAAYGCQEADRSCPPSIKCALDPEDSNHGVSFGGCIPEGWRLDNSELTACADCGGLSESVCTTGAACEGLYGTAPDGSSHFAECVRRGLTGDSALTCASDGQGGKPLLFATTTIPQSWVAEANLAACQPDCFSPWRNTDQIGANVIPGCPCDLPGDLCLEGQGLTCADYTDDVAFNPRWEISETPCATDLTCNGGDRLQDCLERYEVCTESGSIVLDEGTPLYCGDTPLDCALRTEETCTEDCFPYMGRRPGGNTGEFISCGTTACSASRTICATDANDNWVNFFGCLPPGWTEVDASVCDG